MHDVYGTDGDGLTSAAVNTLRPRQNGRDFAYDIFKYISVNENL